SVTASGHKIQWPRTILATFDQLEVSAHLLRRPRGISGECGNAVPIAFVRADRNHGIVSRTTSQRTSPRIPDPPSGFVALRILILTIVVCVMPDKVVPLLALVFCAQRARAGRDTHR